MKETKLILITLLFTITGAVRFSTDRCGSGYGKCDSGYCCSKYNWCGTSPDHCGTGCQKSYGTCTGSTTTTTTTTTTSASKVEYVGLRFSLGGVKKQCGKIPDGSPWTHG